MASFEGVTALVELMLAIWSKIRALMPKFVTKGGQHCVRDRVDVVALGIVGTWEVGQKLEVEQMGIRWEKDLRDWWTDGTGRRLSLPRVERDIKFFSKTKGAERRVVDSFYGEGERERGSTTKSDNGSTSDMKGRNGKNKLAFIAFICFSVAY